MLYTYIYVSIFLQGLTRTLLPHKLFQLSEVKTAAKLGEWRALLARKLVQFVVNKLYDECVWGFYMFSIFLFYLHLGCGRLYSSYYSHIWIKNVFINFNEQHFIMKYIYTRIAFFQRKGALFGEFGLFCPSCLSLLCVFSRLIDTRPTWGVSHIQWKW